MCVRIHVCAYIRCLINYILKILRTYTVKSKGFQFLSNWKEGREGKEMESCIFRILDSNL